MSCHPLQHTFVIDKLVFECCQNMDADQRIHDLAEDFVELSEVPSCNKRDLGHREKSIKDVRHFMNKM
jgi:hypothetical protein